jgi:hypothetical protein
VGAIGVGSFGHVELRGRRPGVRGALAQRLAVGLAGSSNVRPGDRRERDKLDCVDLDLT